MALNQLFKVATEFRFEIGGALLATDTLQRKVDTLSNTADQAVSSLQGVGLQLVSQFGAGSAGVLGAISNAIFAADKFKRSQIGFASIIELNSDVLTGNLDTFVDRMGTADTIMKSIQKTARDFALPGGQLLEFTKLLSPILAREGLAGVNFKNALDLSRGVLKAAPTLGIDAFQAEGQLLRTLSGGASGGDPLFRRLQAETKTFKDAGIKDARGFNALEAAERFKILRDSLLEFSDQAEVVDANVNTITGQLQLFRDSFTGAFSLLAPIGETLNKVIIPGFKDLNNFLTSQGPKFVSSFNDILEKTIGDPEKFAVNLQEVRQLGKSTKLSGQLATAFGLLLGAPFVRGLAGKIPVVGGIFDVLLAPFAFLGKSIQAISGNLLGPAFLSISGGLLGFLDTIIVVASRIFVPLLAITTLVETFSRAIAIAKVNDLKRIPEIMPVALALFDRFRIAVGQIFSPFTQIIDAMAQFLAPLFQMSTIFDALEGPLDSIVSIFEFLGTVVTLAHAGLQGLVFSLLQIGDNFANGELFNFSSIGDAFNAGIDSILERVLGKVDGGNATVNQVVNMNGGVNINQEFRENADPDRIAFSVKEQLMKVAQNPTQGSRAPSFARLGAQ